MNYFDDEFVAKEKAKISTFIKRQEEFKLKFPSEEKKMEIYAKHKAYREVEFKKKLNERELFQDEFGYNIVMVKTHNEALLDSETGLAWNTPKAVDPPAENYPNEKVMSVYCPLMGKLKFSVKMHESLYEGVGWKFFLLLRGEVYYMYQAIEDPNIGKKGKQTWFIEKDFLPKINGFNGANCKYINQVDRDTYNRKFIFRAHQRLAFKEMED